MKKFISCLLVFTLMVALFAIMVPAKAAPTRPEFDGIQIHRQLETFATDTSNFAGVKVIGEGEELDVPGVVSDGTITFTPIQSAFYEIPIKGTTSVDGTGKGDWTDADGIAFYFKSSIYSIMTFGFLHAYNSETDERTGYDADAEIGFYYMDGSYEPIINREYDFVVPPDCEGYLVYSFSNFTQIDLKNIASLGFYSYMGDSNEDKMTISIGDIFLYKEGAGTATKTPETNATAQATTTAPAESKTPTASPTATASPSATTASPSATTVSPSATSSKTPGIDMQKNDILPYIIGAVIILAVAGVTLFLIGKRKKPGVE